MAALLAQVQDPASIPLLGRDAELGRFADLLRGRTPALVVVRAATGMGKTSFLRATEQLAHREGWTTARADAKGELEVTPQTTRKEFTARLRTLLGLPSHQALAAGAGDYERGTAGPDRSSRIRTQPNRRQQGFLDPLAEQLRDLRGRVLLILDGYRPSEKFAAWFERTFLPDLERGEAQVITLLAEAPHALALERLGFHVTAIIDLDALERAAVASYFRALGEHADPPLTPAEIETFAACADQPPLVAALVRLLSLSVPAPEGAVA